MAGGSLIFIKTKYSKQFQKKESGEVKSSKNEKDITEYLGLMPSITRGT